MLSPFILHTTFISMAGTVKINAADIAAAKAAWQAAWPQARRIWSPFVKLREPVWCLTTADAAKEGLQGSFAMIRLTDHRIVIDMEEVVRSGVQSFATEVLAHEIGHHIYTPANLHDNAVMLARIRWGLADLENRAPFAANLYADLLINDKLQRTKGLNLQGVYAQINTTVAYSEVWVLMMRTYEYLWKLKRGALSGSNEWQTDKLDADASLMASLIRSYAKNWIDGSARFAALFYPYLLEEEKYRKSRESMTRLLDAESAGEGGGMISGLTEIDPDSMDVEDPRLEELDKEYKSSRRGKGGGKSETGGVGPHNKYAPPATYIDLQRQLNSKISEQEILNQYYREIALPHLISFPLEKSSPTSFTLPEGVDTWETGDPLEEIDWLQTTIASPTFIPGFNTRKRIYGEDNEESQNSKPLDVYLGIDCSGSMVNPRNHFSWPVLAATVIGLSALRAGANVMACLSGEPGSFLEMAHYSSSEKEVMTVLTSYLGTGYAYGIPRLKKPFGKKLKTPSHVLIVTDTDIFSMLNADTMGEESNWKIIERSLQNAGGIGTLLLHADEGGYPDDVKRLTAMGWRIFYVTDEAGMLDFAAHFAEENYNFNNLP